MERELTNEQIDQYLATNNNKIISTLYELIVKIYFEEEKRTFSIDNKAAQLFTPLGLLISGILLGCSLFIKSNSSLPDGCLGCFTVLICIGIALTLIISLIFLFRSIKTRSDFLCISDSIFSDIHKVESQPLNERVKTDEEKEERESHDNNYMRSLISHIWKNYNNNYFINEKKSKNLSKAQLWFMFSITLSLATTSILTIVNYG